MSNTTCRRAVPPRGLKSRRISPSPPPPQIQAAFCAAWRFGEGAMGVGLYSVSCGYGCGCGFGGLTSLIAMVLALRAREALRMGMGGKVFSGPSLRCGARSVRRSASRRLVIANGDQRPLAPKCRAALAAPCGHFASLVRSSSTARLPSENFVLLRRIWRPVQHFRRPSRSSAWFKGGETPPSELRTLPSPFTFTPPSVRG